MAASITAGGTPIATLVSDTTVRVPGDTNLVDAARALVEADVGLVVVGDGIDVSGVLSERDIVQAVAQGCDPAETRASSLAHHDLAWCDVSATVAEVAEEMMERYVRHILVEDNGRLVGLVSARDLLGIYASSDQSLPDG